MCVNNANNEASAASETDSGAPDSVSETVAELRNLHRQDAQQAALKVFDILDEHSSLRYDVTHAEYAGHVVGLAIGEELISSIPLCIALRHVLEDLNEADPSSKQRAFGMAAIKHFHHRLCEWPEFAHSLLDTAALSAHHPLRAQVQASIRSRTFIYWWTRAAASKA
jgi:CCR4-NOT transcription complex subunit 1 TTP binding domain